MINSNVEKLVPELKEVVNLFGELEEFPLEHNVVYDGTKIYNKVRLLGGTVLSNATTTDFFYEDVPPKITSELEEKRYIKRYAKLSVYKTLLTLTGMHMPWGALTGIRPTKMAQSQLLLTGEYEQFFKDMDVSMEKTELVKSILKSQEGIYEVSSNNTDFFVGIPFCPTRCSYCSFISNDLKSSKKLVEPYVDVLCEEIEFSKQFIKNLRSVYIGGGTPVTLPKELLVKVLKAIGDNGVEFTVEAGRPDCITEESLEILKEHGVTRICVNPQTFNDKTLALIGRRHTAKDVFDKFELAKKYGFNVNMDLIAGLPQENIEDFIHSIDTAISLSPDNITVHTLCLKKGADLTRVNRRLEGLTAFNMVEYSHKALKDAGYLPYYLYRQKYMAGNLENTGYAKPNKACVYNIDVMEEISNNVACGANAVSKAIFDGGERIERYANPKDVRTYIAKIETLKAEKTKLFCPEI